MDASEAAMPDEVSFAATLDKLARRGKFNHTFDMIHGHTLRATRIVADWLRETPTFFTFKGDIAFAAEQEVIRLAINVLGNPKLAIAALRGCRGDLGALWEDLIAVRDGAETIEALVKRRAEERAVRGSADAAYEAVVDKVIERRVARENRKSR